MGVALTIALHRLAHSRGAMLQPCALQPRSSAAARCLTAEGVSAGMPAIGFDGATSKIGRGRTSRHGVSGLAASALISHQQRCSKRSNDTTGVLTWASLYEAYSPR